MTDTLRAALEDFMGWLFRDGGLEPPRREYDDVEQRLRGLLIAGLMNHPAADTARPGLDVEALARAMEQFYSKAEGTMLDSAAAIAAEYIRLTEDRP